MITKIKVLVNTIILSSASLKKLSSGTPNTITNRLDKKKKKNQQAYFTKFYFLKNAQIILHEYSFSSSQQINSSCKQWYNYYLLSSLPCSDVKFQFKSR